MAFDAEAPWELPPSFWPEGQGERPVQDPDAPQASATCLTVPVLHSQDIDVPDDYPPDEPLPEAQVEVVVSVVDSPQACPYEFVIECPSGRLNVGDAECERVLGVPAGDIRVGVRQDPPQFAERVLLEISAA
jgi:hypothetical protein